MREPGPDHPPGVRVLRAGERAAVPWKNGGGTTREIAAYPHDAGTDGFDWRVSLAEVSRDGPFSVFPGADRILTVVEGAGLDLDVGGRLRHIGARHVPQDFPGDLPTDCELLAGPVVNLNVMYRRGRASATVAVVRGEHEVPVPAGAVVLAVALEGEVTAAGAALAPYDAVLLTPGEEERGAHLILAGAGCTALITLRPSDPVGPSDPVSPSDPVREGRTSR
jgi:environmental stress-induced protein Ves